MGVIALCVALVAVGVVLVVRWGGDPERPRGSLPRYVAVALVAGCVAGVLVAGAGSRLVMRLLALTSQDVEGSFTEADEVIGDISLEGTLGLIVFGGLPAGVLTGAVYALAGPVLPRGRVGGVALGLLVLVLAGTRIDPLRADNFDFDLVGPPWLAVLGFTAVAVLSGMVVVAVANRLGAAAPRPRTVHRVAVIALLLVALPGFVAAIADILS